MLGLIENQLVEANIPYVKLMGQTKNREVVIEEKILKMQQNKASLMAGLFTEKFASKANLTEVDFQALFEAY